MNDVLKIRIYPVELLSKRSFCQRCHEVHVIAALIIKLFGGIIRSHIRLAFDQQSLYYCMIYMILIFNKSELNDRCIFDIK